MPTFKKSRSGFSLIELLVAVVILAVGMLGLAELQITAMRTNSKSEGILAATSIAQDAIEQVQALDGSDPWLQSATATPLPLSLPSGSISIQGGGTYTVTYERVTPYEGVNNLCWIRVTVVPSNNVASSSVFSRRSVTMTTLKRT
ncbi:MAG: type IV pilus modification PilV family protein [Desulfuromonadales bacterium]